jgi:hypothetical protein
LKFREREEVVPRSGITVAVGLGLGDGVTDVRVREGREGEGEGETDEEGEKIEGRGSVCWSVPGVHDTCSLDRIGFRSTFCKCDVRWKAEKSDRHRRVKRSFENPSWKKYTAPISPRKQCEGGVGGCERTPKEPLKVLLFWKLGYWRG